jgi:glycosyltransferase involved in cell wall biosynthesis
VRILVGVTEVANIVSEIGNALAGVGWQTDTLAVRHPYYGSNRYTYEVALPATRSRLLRFLVLRAALARRFLSLLFRYDVFVFVWSHTFLPGGLDLVLLRALGKKVIVFNCGDEVRFRPIHNRIDAELLGRPSWPELPLLSGNAHFLRAFYRQKLAELVCNRLVSTRNQATFQKKPFAFFRTPVRRLTARPRKAAPVPLVVHAPTDPATKGTGYVTAAVERLRREGLAFEFELIRDRDHGYVIERLLQADIVIDQPATWLAKLAVEAMAAGCAVIGGNDPVYEGLDDERSPAVPFQRDAEALAASLRRLILDAVQRERLMADSYEYWERRYSPEAFADYFSRLLAGTAPTVDRPPGHRELLLRAAANRFQRAVIAAFY